MPSLTFKVIIDPKQAQSFWEQFSPHQTIDDEWDFRNIFTQELELPFHFIVGFDKEKPVGLLPMQQNQVKGLDAKLLNENKPFLEFFSGIDTDDNKVWLTKGYDNCLDQFLNQLTSHTVLTSLRPKYKTETSESEYYLDRYELNLQEFPNFETFLQKNFDGKSRQRLVNSLNKLNKSFKVEIVDGSGEGLDILFNLSKKRFGEKSSFHLQYRQNIYHNLLKKFNVDIFKIHLDGEPKAISFAIHFKNAYISINVGYDVEIRDVVKLLCATQIKRAMEKKCIRYDAGQGNNGWKEHFHLTKIPQYKLTLN